MTENTTWPPDPALDAPASRTTADDDASSSPEPGAVEALARLWTRHEQVGDVWAQLHPVDQEHRLNVARTVLAAGYLSPADVGRVVAAAKAEALSEFAVSLREMPDLGALGAAVLAEKQAEILLAAGPERRTEPHEAERAPEEQLLWDIFAKPPEHQLLGTVCSCGEWSAGCGHDVTGQWADHLRSAHRWEEIKNTTLRAVDSAYGTDPPAWLAGPRRRRRGGIREAAAMGSCTALRPRNRCRGGVRR